MPVARLSSSYLGTALRRTSLGVGGAEGIVGETMLGAGEGRLEAMEEMEGV